MYFEKTNDTPFNLPGILVHLQCNRASMPKSAIFKLPPLEPYFHKVQKNDTQQLI